MWGFFYVARMDEVFTHPTTGAPHIPRRCTPAQSAPGRTAHGRQQRRPCQMQGRPRHAPTHTPGRRTRCTGLYQIPDRPRLDDRTGCGVLDYLYNVSETEQIRTIERHTKTGLKIITFSCMFVACATLQIH